MRPGGFWLLIALLLVPTTAEAQGTAAPDPNRDIRVLRQEIRNLRRDLNLARTGLEKTRKDALSGEQRLTAEIGAQGRELQDLRDRANWLTGGVVLIGVVGVLAGLLGARRGRAAEQRELAHTRSRIAEIRAQLAADESHAEPPSLRSTKEPNAAHRTYHGLSNRK